MRGLPDLSPLLYDAIAPFLVFENGNLKNFWFNHNTIVNHAQFLFRSENWINCLIMNNLFINAHFAGEPATRRDGQDPDAIPYGVMTVAVPDSSWEGYPAENERVVLVAHNNNFVSQEIKDWWGQAVVNFDSIDWQVTDYTKGDNGFFNSRTDSLMNDDNHPKILWDDEYSILTEDPNLLNYTFDFTGMINWSRSSMGEQGLGDITWGQHPQGDPKIPMAGDLLTFEYDNSTLLTAVYQGYPVGDLNWFPTQKASWDEDPDKEVYETILAKINDGTWEFGPTISVEDITDSQTPSGVCLGQNHPNPFRSSTKISLTIPEPGQVSIKVMNILGQQVAEPVHQYLGGGMHEVVLNADRFSSGTYFYLMDYGDVRLTRQLFIMK